MDIDIDFRTDFDPLDHFPTAVKASRVDKGVLKPHPAGAYLQTIPKDGITGLSAIPFKEAEALGYLKVDFLHIGLLDSFESKEEIRELLKLEPDWSLLEHQENVEKLTQISRHFDLVYRLKPQSVEDLADLIALIRPGKRGMLAAYLEDKAAIRKILYKKPDDPDKYYFKRSHSLAYSLNIVLQLHLLKAEII